ncbi:hypothetical protein HPP92_013630 [Vanilla planifolia]|uniref:DUF4408 domain-containing protein n=1 Tax=Vanilla planifolia TaxID=51239 RepID=A0A835QSN9_VANPL|nr:hypothetical protein HPP92_013630 [Vanilla planifolia]
MGDRVFSIKIATASAVVLLAAVALWLATPAVAEFFTEEAPRVYGTVAAWLTPPYLYFVINGIIITIVATSRFQKPFEAASDNLASHPGFSAAPSHMSVVEDHPRPDGYITTVDERADLQLGFLIPETCEGHGEIVELSTTAELPPEEGFFLARSMWSSNRRDSDEALPEKPTNSGLAVGKPLVSSRKDRRSLMASLEASGGENEVLSLPLAETEPPSEVEFGVSDLDCLPWTDSIEALPAKSSPNGLAAEKPLVSTRLGRRRSIKGNPEGKALRVARPRKQETLENTWRKITEGRAVPLTRHLNKCDTWDHPERDTGGAVSPSPPSPSMKKSETFVVLSGAAAESSPSTVRLRREPSVGQDDLNRRVEAFIKKFNEEMRLQRQQSLQQYMDMISRGSH